MNNGKILWKNGKPSLWIKGGENNIWGVENGNWLLKLNGLSGEVVKTGSKLLFDKITDAPEGNDYNKVLDSAG